VAAEDHAQHGDAAAEDDRARIGSGAPRRRGEGGRRERPESAFPEITLTKLLIEQGRLAEARHYYDLAKSIDPDDKELAALATLVDQPVQSTAA
jgi:hypothetical protein